MSKKLLILNIVLALFFIFQLSEASSFTACTLAGGGTPGCGAVASWGSSDMRAKVLTAAKNNPGTAYMAWCPYTGATPYARAVVAACDCPNLKPAPGECSTGACSACGNPVAKCSPQPPPPEPGNLEGYKFDKESGDKLNGWQITLKKNGIAIKSTFTGLSKAGYYKFTDLDAGTYTVEESIESGWEVPAGYSRVYTVVIHEGRTKTQNFYNQRVKGCLEGYKRDTVNIGLPDWQIHARNVNTGQEFVTRTEGTGKYRFSRLDSGTWEVWEELESGWEVAPGHSLKYTVNINAGSSCRRQDFVNKQKAVEKGCVDVIKRDDDHVGLPGWVIHAKKAGKPDSGGLTRITGQDGKTRFTDLDPGLYEFWEELQPGWEPVTSARFRSEVTSGPCIQIAFKNKYGCSNECRAGEMKCEGNGVWECGNFDEDECLEWNLRKQCGDDSCISHTNLDPFVFEYIQDLGSCQETNGRAYCAESQTVYDTCIPNTDTVMQPFCSGNDYDFQNFDCNTLDGCYEFTYTQCVSCSDMYGNCIDTNCTRTGKEYRDYLCGAGKCMFTISPIDKDNDKVDERCDGCIDVDMDGICDNEDNCLAISNPSQVDTDRDGSGDACDTDRDGDGYNADNDCNDWNYDINPGQKEINNNGLDDDCNPDTEDRVADTSKEVLFVDIQTTEEASLKPGSAMTVVVSVTNHDEKRLNSVQVAVSLPDYQIMQTKQIEEIRPKETVQRTFVITLPNSFISRYETMRVSVGNDEYKRIVYRELKLPW